MVDQSAVEKFKTFLRGELLRPGDPGYDDARKIWNGMSDKRRLSSRAALASPM